MLLENSKNKEEYEMNLNEITVKESRKCITSTKNVEKKCI